MNTDKKLEHFMDISIQSAGQQAADIIEKYRTGLDEGFEAHKDSLKAASKDTLDTKKSIIRRNVKKALSDKETEIKKQFTTKNLYYRQKIFDEAVEILHEFKNSPEYFDYMCKAINNALHFANGENIKIYIVPEDLPLKEKLCNAVNAEIEVSDSDFTGGIRAVIPSINILIDESFETKLAELKENYRINY